MLELTSWGMGPFNLGIFMGKEPNLGIFYLKKCLKKVFLKISIKKTRKSRDAEHCCQ